MASVKPEYKKLFDEVVMALNYMPVRPDYTDEDNDLHPHIKDQIAKLLCH